MGECVDIRQRIRRLHPGQLAIILLVAIFVLAVVVSMRSKVAAGKRLNEYLLSPALEASIPRLQYTPRPCDDRFSSACADLKAHDRLLRFEIAEYEVRLFSVDSVIVSMTGLWLLVAWVWFGGRIAPLPRSEPAASSQPTPAVENKTEAGLDWKSLRRHPVVRVIELLLLVILGIVVFRIAEEVMLAIRSAL